MLRTVRPAALWFLLVAPCLFWLALHAHARWHVEEMARFLSRPMSDYSTDSFPYLTTDSLTRVSLREPFWRLRVAATLRRMAAYHLAARSTAEMDRPSEPGVPSAEEWVNSGGVERWKTFLALARAGERAEPGNAFFTTLRGLAHLAPVFHNPDAAVAAFREAAGKHYWNDYRQEEREAEWRREQRKGTPAGASLALRAWVTGRTGEEDALGELWREADAHATELENKGLWRTAGEVRADAARLALLRRDGTTDLRQKCETGGLLRAAFGGAGRVSHDPNHPAAPDELLAAYSSRYARATGTPPPWIGAVEGAARDHGRLVWLERSSRDQAGSLWSARWWAEQGAVGFASAVLLAGAVCTAVLGLARAVTARLPNYAARTVADAACVVAILLYVQTAVAPNLAFLFGQSLGEWWANGIQPGLLVPYLVTALVVGPGLTLRFRALAQSRCSGEEACPQVTARVASSTVPVVAVFVVAYAASVACLMARDDRRAADFRASVADETRHRARLVRAAWPLTTVTARDIAPGPRR